jgi:hypothetical protein
MLPVGTPFGKEPGGRGAPGPRGAGRRGTGDQQPATGYQRRPAPWVA